MNPTTQTPASATPDADASQGPGTKNAEREAALAMRKEQREFIDSYLSFRDLLQTRLAENMAATAGEPDDEKYDMFSADWMKANEERIASLFMSYRKDKRDGPRSQAPSAGYAPRSGGYTPRSGASSSRPASEKQVNYVRKLIQQGNLKEADVLNATRTESLEVAAAALTSSQASELINAGIRASGREPSPPPQRGHGASRKW